MSRAHTEDEAREIFISACRSLSDYWSGLEGRSKKEACEGLLFSIMNIIDGTSGSFPCAIDLVLSPHEDDKQFSIDNGENYMEAGMVINNCMLHEVVLSDGE